MNKRQSPLDHSCLAKPLREIREEFRDTPLNANARERLRALGGIGTMEISGVCPAPDCSVNFSTEGRRLYVHGDIGQTATSQDVVIFAPGMLRHGIVDPSMTYDPNTFFAAARLQDEAARPLSPPPNMPTLPR